MFNLVIKDLLVQKKYMLFTAAFGVFIMFFFGLQGGPLVPAAYIFITFAMSYFFLVNTCQADEKNNSEIILNSLPISRNDIVISKYFLSLVIILGTLLFISLVGALYYTLGVGEVVLISRLELTLAVMVSSLFISLYLPLFFRFGQSKTRMFTMAVFFILFFVPGHVIKFALENPDNPVVESVLHLLENNPSMLITFGLLFTISLMLLSMAISVRFYRFREF